jgi:hypothetical protein
LGLVPSPNPQSQPVGLGHPIPNKYEAGSFMRLFGHISWANESDQKIERTTPVFMEKGDQKSNSKMGFVMPQDVATAGAPKPKGAEVSIRKREGGRFAVIRLSGRMNTDLAGQRQFGAEFGGFTMIFPRRI